MSNNNNLQSAKENKFDEFYTMYADIEKELCYYTKFFSNKIIYLPCDNPEQSNFWLYFVLNHDILGYKRLIASFLNGNCTVYDGENKVKHIALETGDFRSQECLDIMDQSDIIVTNPPFSLFRDMINILINKDKKFLLLGALNNITYKDVFPHLQERRFQLGINSGSFCFRTISKKKDNTQKKNGKLIAKFGNICWYTNMNHEYKHEPLSLVQDDILKYPVYDDLKIIDVNRITRIPDNYDKPMGVPVTVLQYFNPDQFIILGNLGSYGVDGYSVASAIYINGKKQFKRILIRRTRESDFVYRPSMHKISQQSLERFAHSFNSWFMFSNIRLYPQERETYDNDGYIIDTNTGIKIGIDWEIRDRYFKDGIFRFNTLGQYERKILKSSIDLSIQCDSNETHVIVAWHKDYKDKDVLHVPCLTDKKDQDCPVRYTDKFKIYSYDKLYLLKHDLQEALRIQHYSFERSNNNV